MAPARPGLSLHAGPTSADRHRHRHLTHPHLLTRAARGGVNVSLGRLVLVPGLTASELSFGETLLGPNVIWLNPLRLCTGGFKKMYLPAPDDPPGTNYVNELTQGGPIGLYYWPLC